MPVMVTAKQAGRKAIIFFGSGFWRWRLMMQSDDSASDAYHILMNNCVRWLVAADLAERFNVSLNKDVYRAGEDIIVTAEAYTEDYQPRTDVHIELKISGQDYTQQLALENLGDGVYRGVATILAGGDYHFMAEGRRIQQLDDLTASASGRFTVDPFRVENQDVNANFELMHSLARQSQGTSIPLDSLAAWAATMRTAPKNMRATHEYELWQAWPVLMLIIVLLSVEWLLRKRLGMI